MGLLNKIFGNDESQAQQNTQNAQAAQTPRTTVTPVQPGQTQTTTRPGDGQEAASEDEMAVARYRYMLRTAPPETLEQAHAEAFQKLTPEQRRLALQQLAEADPEARNASDDPQTLARLATRAEVRQPGFLERTFGGAGMGGGGMMGGGGIGMGGLIAGSLLTSVAGTFIGSAIAHSFFDNPAHAAGFAQSGLAPNGGDTTINNYYGDNEGGAGSDGAGAAGGADATGDVNSSNATDMSSLTGNDPTTGGFFDTTGTAVDTDMADIGSDLGDFGGDF